MLKMSDQKPTPQFRSAACEDRKPRNQEKRASFPAESSGANVLVPVPYYAASRIFIGAGTFNSFFNSQRPASGAPFHC